MSSSKRKKQRRQERHIKNREKDFQYKQLAWESGRLIEENHNGGEYSPERTKEMASRLISFIRNFKEISKDNNDLIRKYQLIKSNIQTLILHWSSEIPREKDYEYLKTSLETYWDIPDNLFQVI